MGIQFSGEHGKRPLLTMHRLGYNHPDFFELNYGNAVAFFGLLGWTFEPVGSRTVAEARRAIMGAKARFDRTAPLHTREGSDTKDPGRARIVRGPLNEEGLRTRLERFEKLVQWLIDIEADRLVWS